MDDECINWGWHSFPGQMRPAAAGRPPDLECGRGWRDSLTLVRSAFAFYSQTPSQKRKGVQYCTQCNGLPDTALIHIHLGQISNDLSAGENPNFLRDTGDVGRARPSRAREALAGSFATRTFARSFSFHHGHIHRRPPSSASAPSPRHHASDTRPPSFLPAHTDEVRRTRATLDDVIIACAVDDDLG